MASFPNVYTHRKVAATASKPCEICYKPSTSVLVTPENKVSQTLSTFYTPYSSQKDFFYVCPTHLRDKGFCLPIIDEAAVAAKKKKEMEAEIERVKQDFEERQKKKKEKEKAKEKEKDNDRGEKDDVKDDKKFEEKVRSPTSCVQRLS